MGSQIWEVFKKDWKSFSSKMFLLSWAKCVASDHFQSYDATSVGICEGTKTPLRFNLGV